jgi:hypothetical protein
VSQINLFSGRITRESHPDFVEYLNTFKDGALLPISAVRMLTEKPHPHVRFEKNGVSDYIVFAVEKPLVVDHISWLYRRVLIETDKEPPDRNEFYEYLWSVLFPKTPRHRRSEAQWEKIKEARQHFEIPHLAFKHYAATQKEGRGEEVFIERTHGFVVIEYNKAPVKTPEPADEAVV